MKGKASQKPSFADAFVDIPSGELDATAEIPGRVRHGTAFARIRGDRNAESLFRASLLREPRNLSRERLSDSPRRDLVFMGFRGFSISGHKPDETTLERFPDKLSRKGARKKLPSKINRLPERENLKINDGGYMVADATPTPSSRGPRKTYATEADGSVFGPEYSDDRDAAYMKKGEKPRHGYAATALTDADGLVEQVAVSPAKASGRVLRKMWRSARGQAYYIRQGH